MAIWYHAEGLLLRIDAGASLVYLGPGGSGKEKEPLEPTWSML